MNTTERQELGELNHGAIAQVLGSDSVVNVVGGSSVVIDGIVVPEGWELIREGELKKLRANPEFLTRGTRYPAWKIEDERGNVRLAYELELFEVPNLRSAHTPFGSEMCGMAWVETRGPIVARFTKPTV